jgi:hypothetical protein
MTETRRTWLGLLGVMAAVALAAGCGGESEGGAASGGSSTAGAGSDGAVKYAECMRENGVPNFPDPENGRLVLRAGPDSGIDPNSPEFRSAQEACQSLAPSGAQNGGGGAGAEMEAQVLEYAKCMRENGVPEFPDPNFSDGGVRMQLPPGVDQNSPQFQAAQRACASILSELGGAP